MSQKVILIGKENETVDVKTFKFAPVAEVTWKAGQFMVLDVPHANPDEKGTERYFTISAAPFEKNLQITTRMTGSTFKNALDDLPIGSELTIKEIDGDFTLDSPIGDYVFIAGGIGITPFRSILCQLVHLRKPINALLLYGNRTEDIIFKEELEEVVHKNPNFKIKYLISPEKIDEASIRANVSDLNKPIFYVSGPEPMVEDFEKMLINDLHISKDCLKTDFFPGYDEKNF